MFIDFAAEFPISFARKAFSRGGKLFMLLIESDREKKSQLLAKKCLMLLQTCGE
jgi:hypothetical protein